jgi:hypothetical protein
VEFGVRIDYYRDLDTRPADRDSYVGSVWREDMSGVIVPGVGDYIQSLGRQDARDGGARARRRAP